MLDENVAVLLQEFTVPETLYLPFLIEPLWQIFVEEMTPR